MGLVTSGFRNRVASTGARKAKRVVYPEATWWTLPDDVEAAAALAEHLADQSLTGRVAPHA